jgi:hypothetical protein
MKVQGCHFHRVLCLASAILLSSECLCTAGTASNDVLASHGALGIQASMPKPVADMPSPELRVPNDVVHILLWTGLVLGAGVLAFALKDALPARFARSARWDEVDGHNGSGRARASRREVGDTADDLARAGRFAEAMHLLLLTSLADLRRRLDLRFADSLTSREIQRRVSLPERGKAAFGALVGAVELTHFGGRPVDEENYWACRSQYDLLTEALDEAAS